MKKTLFRTIVILLLGSLLASCGGQEAFTPTAESVPTEQEAVEPTPTQPEEPPGAEPTAAAETPTEVAAATPASNLTDGCVENYDPTVDYFPDKVEVTKAEGFTVDYANNYKVVTVLTPFSGAEQANQYVLVQCGTPIPESFAPMKVIEVPIHSIVAMSTTYLPALKQLDLLDTLVGVDSGLYTTSKEVLDLIDSGAVAEIGNGTEVNVEMAVDLDPDLIMANATGSPDYDAHPKLEEAGLPVVINSDYLDTSPLGRAEWVDFIALFYNKEAASEAWFDGVVSDYESLAAMSAEVEERPTVFVNTPFDGTWFLPGGENYFARLLADAGSDYLWSNDGSTGSLFLDFESVFDQAADADFWLNPGVYGTLDDLLATDERFGEFAAFQNGNVYNNDARSNENGGSDFYESGVVFPNVVLADLIKIFHPELLPDHELVYYRHMEGSGS
ncbi:MAG: ABC transporter substrate-binding protein [Candidatus Promineifilaceae bacterium]